MCARRNGCDGAGGGGGGAGRRRRVEACAEHLHDGRHLLARHRRRRQHAHNLVGLRLLAHTLELCQLRRRRVARRWLLLGIVLLLKVVGVRLARVQTRTRRARPTARRGAALSESLLGFAQRGTHHRVDVSTLFHRLITEKRRLLRHRGRRRRRRRLPRRRLPRRRRLLHDRRRQPPVQRLARARPRRRRQRRLLRRRPRRRRLCRRRHRAQRGAVPAASSAAAPAPPLPSSAALGPSSAAARPCEAAAGAPAVVRRRPQRRRRRGRRRRRPSRSARPSAAASPPPSSGEGRRAPPPRRGARPAGVPPPARPALRRSAAPTAARTAPRRRRGRRAAGAAGRRPRRRRRRGPAARVRRARRANSSITLRMRTRWPGIGRIASITASSLAGRRRSSAATLVKPWSCTNLRAYCVSPRSRSASSKSATSRRGPLDGRAPRPPGGALPTRSAARRSPCGDCGMSGRPVSGRRSTFSVL